MSERWAFILDGCYAISDQGRVARARPRWDAKHPERFQPYLLKLTYWNDYLSFCPSIKGDQSTRYCVHVLVAQTFNGPCPPKHEVNHRDGVKTNNAARNLEYRTHKGNMEHAVAIGLPVGRPPVASLCLRKRS